MKEIHSYGIYYHTSNPDLHNQKPGDGVIRELRYKFYLVVLKKRVTSQLWDYGIIWVLEVMSLTHYSENSVNGGIILKNVTVQTVDLSEYPDFSFYDKVWFKDNYSLSLIEPGRWLWISHRKGSLMCYHKLTQTEKVISIYKVQQVTNFN